jgi:hypothetical protein
MGARKHSEIEIAAEDRQESVAVFDWERLPHALSQLQTIQGRDTSR